MINSMTGYGAAEGYFNGVTYAVEIKSVNNRYVKTVLKLPDAAAFLEPDIEQLLRETLTRGTVNFTLRLRNATADVLFDINESALRTFIERLKRVAGTVDGGSLDIGSLLALPGVLVPPSPDANLCDKIRQTVLGTAQKALEKLQRMRAAEGAALSADMEGHCLVIREDLEKIRLRNPLILEEYAKRLKKRVDELLAHAQLGLDEATLAREVAVFADKSDISEELARLESHLEQFFDGCRSSTEAGRRLEFITQEMLREANTIASKACDNEIAKCVINIKCRVERLKEQVQNVE
jgi:uncharacterized protein (TIGR00255 family)